MYGKPSMNSVLINAINLGDTPMQVELEKVFPVTATSDASWSFLQDIRGVAECMPGAEITEQLDDKHFNGQVKVKIGPATASFKGEIEIKDMNTKMRVLRLLGKGADTKGTSSASMDLTASIRDADNGHSELVGKSTITVNGKMASFGGRMMVQVADQILKQFADNFANRVIASAGEGDAASEAAAKLAEQPKEINGIAIMWQVIVGFFKNLFGKQSNPT